MGGVVDAISDFVSDVVDTAIDLVETAIDITIDIGQDVLDVAVDLNEAIFDFAIGSLALVAEPIGLGSITDTLSDALTGITYLSHEAISGNWDAVLQLAVLAGSVAMTVMTFGSTAPATSAVLASYGLGITSSTVLMGVYYATYAIGLSMSIYSLYGIVISIAELGVMIAKGGVSSLFNQLNAMKDAMNLAFVNSWINGSMNLWMAGGQLYDSPKAGDVLFNPTGDLNTTRFLNRPNRNDNTWSRWNLGKYHDYQKQVFGNLAGNDFFAVAPLAQRI